MSTTPQHQEAYRSYEELHIQFVTSEYGTSVLEIIFLLYSVTLLPLLASLLLPWIVPSSYNRYTKNYPNVVTFTRIIVEYPIVMLLPIFMITIFTGGDNQDGSPHGVMHETSYDNEEGTPGRGYLIFTPCVAIALTFICAGIFVVNHSITKPVWSGFSTHWNTIKVQQINWSRATYLLEEQKKTDELPSKPVKTSSAKLPFITNYRALVTYLTVLSIIAVDFRVFPRRFCKTKLYGFSLMDIGTGSFVFANGIVSSEARIMKSDLKKSLISSVPLAILGLIRLATVKGLEYHEVVEEYGIHWNFFFTLAVVKILSALVFTFVPVSLTIKTAAILSCLYEVLLVYFELQSKFILNSAIPRSTSLIAANREGIFSTVGYTVIYLVSIYVGQILYNNKFERKTIYDWCACAFQTSVQITILWILTHTSITYGNSSCRRIANMSYILWIISANFTVLWLCLVVQLVQIVSQKMGLLHGPMLFFELCTKNETEQRKQKEGCLSTNFKPLEEPEDENESVPDDNILETIEEELNRLQQKLNEMNDLAKEHGEASDVEGLKEFSSQLEGELERVTEQWNNELEKKVKQHKKNQKSEVQEPKDMIQLPDLTKPPVTLEAICYNGLFVFLIGNLLTGLVNMSMRTIYVPTLISIFILWGYASSIVLISVSLYWFQIQLKFW